MKYIVLKVEDINKYCTNKQQDELEAIIHEIQDGRAKDNKKENKYIVVNTDEIYAPAVFELMHLHGHTVDFGDCS